MFMVDISALPIAHYLSDDVVEFGPVFACGFGPYELWRRLWYVFEFCYKGGPERIVVAWDIGIYVAFDIFTEFFQRVGTSK